VYRVDANSGAESKTALGDDYAPVAPVERWAIELHISR
jgi:hypothetical protein